jgi:hypothetical protein
MGETTDATELEVLSHKSIRPDGKRLDVGTRFEVGVVSDGTAAVLARVSFRDFPFLGKRRSSDPRTEVTAVMVSGDSPSVEYTFRPVLSTEERSGKILPFARAALAASEIVAPVINADENQ